MFAYALVVVDVETIYLDRSDQSWILGTKSNILWFKLIEKTHGAITKCGNFLLTFNCCFHNMGSRYMKICDVNIFCWWYFLFTSWSHQTISYNSIHIEIHTSFIILLSSMALYTSVLYRNILYLKVFLGLCYAVHIWIWFICLIQRYLHVVSEDTPSFYDLYLNTN